MNYQYHAVIRDYDANKITYAVFHSKEELDQFFTDRLIPESKRIWGSELNNAPYGATEYPYDFSRELANTAEVLEEMGTTE
jgi:hypothetical protein